LADPCFMALGAGALEDGFGHSGFDQAGANRIDAYPAVGEL
jgi:hypothetical protein